MSDTPVTKYTAVTHITLRARSEIERTPEGLRVTLVEAPKWLADTVVNYNTNPALSDSALQVIGQLLACALAQKFASMPEMPKDVEAKNELTDVLPTANPNTEKN